MNALSCPIVDIHVIVVVYIVMGLKFDMKFITFLLLMLFALLTSIVLCLKRLLIRLTPVGCSSQYVDRCIPTNFYIKALKKNQQVQALCKF